MQQMSSGACAVRWSPRLTHQHMRLAALRHAAVLPRLAIKTPIRHSVGPSIVQRSPLRMTSSVTVFQTSAYKRTNTSSDTYRSLLSKCAHSDSKSDLGSRTSLAHYSWNIFFCPPLAALLCGSSQPWQGCRTHGGRSGQRSAAPSEESDVSGVCAHGRLVSHSVVDCLPMRAWGASLGVTRHRPSPGVHQHSISRMQG